jgi:pimeloyl-ACP methyl ester carboxylesterase
VLFGMSLGLFGSLTLIAALLATDQTFYLPRPAGLSFVKTGAFNTRYQAFGPPMSQSKQPPVVLLHGAFESVATWEPVAIRLARFTHVEAIDLSGYGFTDRVGPYTLDGLIAQLHHFLHARHLVHPVLVGHSLGAGVIAGYVLKYPDDARAIVFVDGDGLAVKEARIDEPALAIEGGLGDDKAGWVLLRRADHRRVAEPIGVGKIQIALVVGRAAEDGAGPIVHEDEVCDIHRQ